MAVSSVSRRAFLSGLVTVAVGSVLAACAPAAAPTPTPAPAKPAEAPKPAQEAKPAQPAPTPTPAAKEAAPAPKAGVVLRLLETPSATVQAINDDFTKKTGIRIESEVIPQGVDPTAKLIASFNAGGTDYDVVRVDVIDLALYAVSGWIEDVSARITKDLIEDMLPFARQAVNYKGKWYGLPKDSEWKTWVYNEKMLKDVGINKPPETCEEYVMAAKAVQEKGLVKYAQTWAWTQGENIACDYPMLVASLGGKYISENDELLINKDAGVEALRMMVDWLNTTKIANPASLTAKNIDARNAQAAGDAAFGFHWGTPIAVLNDPTKSKVVNQCKMGLVPHKAGVASWTVSGPECWSISKGSRHKDEAWEYLLFRQGREGAKRQFIGEGTVFGWRSLFDDPEIQNFAKQRQIDFEIARRQAENVVNRPMVPWYHEYSAALQLELHNALTQKKSVQQALDDVVSAYNKIKGKAEKRY